MTELQSKAIKRIKEVYAKAEDVYGIPLTFPIVSFKLKGRRAGYVIPAYNKLALNDALLHEHGDNFINDTPGHEAAHLIAYAVYGYNIEPHGTAWKKVMVKVCGQSPTRCHTYEVKPETNTFVNAIKLFMYLPPNIIVFCVVTIDIIARPAM